MLGIGLGMGGAGGTTPSGIGYFTPQRTYQSDTLYTGDNGWYEANSPGTYAPNIPANPEYMATLSDWDTLDNNNIFGNTNRFTDDQGGQIYGASNNSTVRYYVCNHTGLGIYRDTTAYSGIAAYTFQDVINYAEALSVAKGDGSGNYDDFRLPNIKEMQALAVYNRVDQFGYPPLEFLANRQWESSTFWYNTTRTLRFFIGGEIIDSVESTSQTRYFWMIRNHF